MQSNENLERFPSASVFVNSVLFVSVYTYLYVLMLSQGNKKHRRSATAVAFSDIVASGAPVTFFSPTVSTSGSKIHDWDGALQDLKVLSVHSQP